MAVALPEDIETVCLSCERGGEDEIAEKWCHECGEGLCDSCSNYHRKCKQLNKHHIVPLAEMTEVTKLLGKLQIDVHCSLHPEELMVAYCQTDDTNCCGHCALTCHKHCDDLISIEEAAALFKQRFQKENVEKYTELLDHLTSMIEAEDNSISKTKKQINDVCAEGTSRIRKIKQILKRLVESTETVLQQKLRSSVERLQILKDFEAKILNTKKDIQLLPHLSPAHHILVWKILANESKVEYLEMKESFRNGSAVLDCKEHNDLVTAFKNLSALSDVSILTEYQPINDEIQQILQELEKPVQKKDFMKAKIKHIKTSDKNDLGVRSITTITSVAALSDNTLLFLDRGSNLVRIDTNFNITHRYKTNCPASGVCVDNEETYVHVVGDGGCHGTVTTYQLEEWKQTGSFHVPSRPWSIACTADKIITIHPTECVILDKKGHQLHSIIRIDDWYPHVAVSHDGSKLFYKDGNALVCRDMELLTELFRCASLGIASSHGISVDGDDNIYLAGNDQTGHIHQISRDGSVSRVLVRKLQSILQPNAICFNPNNDTLVVTSDTRYPDRYIEIYKFR